jgi:AAA domain-containing protein
VSDVSERYFDEVDWLGDVPTERLDELEESPFRLEEANGAEPAEAAPASHSWRAQDLLVAGAEPPAPPDVGGLFYCGRRHVVSGQDDAGKSWLLLAIAADELRAGRGVVWIDTDYMGPSMALERLRDLGIEDEQIRDLFAYLQPAEALSDAARDDVVTLIRNLGVQLVAIDAFNAALSLHGYSPQSTEEVEAFFGRVVAPFQREGAAVVLPDHVVKNKENRGRYAYGSERKSTGVDLHLGLTPLEPFGRGQRGRSKLTVHRDRVGFLEKPSPGLFVLDSDPDTGRCSWRIEPDHGVSDEGTWRPTGLMEKVSRYLELAGEPRSRNQIEQGVRGKTDYKRQAIDALIEDGFAVEVTSGQTRLVQFDHAFRESDEWAES